MIGYKSLVRAVALFWLVGVAAPAQSELVLSDLVVELEPGKNSRKDIELWNNSGERYFVEITPAEILSPGLPSERRREVPNPEQLGLLVSPNRMILEPGQHKVIRVAAIVSPVERERVYRVTVKPVVGDIADGQAGLKILVGYDVLTLVRPSNPIPKIIGERAGRSLIIRNEGNSSAELLNGKQCATPGKSCTPLRGKRLYPGAEWRLELPGDGPVEFSVKLGAQNSSVRF